MSDDIKRITEADINRLQAELSDLNSYRGWQKAFEEFEIVGITLRRKNVGGGHEDVILHQNKPIGSGSITSFGFSAAFSEYLTKALDRWIDMHIKDRKEALHRSGVETE